MTRAAPSGARWILGAVLWCGLPASAMAHAPLVRRAVFSADGAAAALGMPGFGIALRRDPDSGFSYICDALLDVAPSDVPASMAFTDGGALLIGTASGLRSVTPDGCPRSDFGGELAHAPVTALAVHPRSPNVVYAATLTDKVELARSEDGGRTWELRAAWPASDSVSSLVLDEAETSTVYVSQAGPESRPTVLVSTDGGTSFSTFVQDRARTLLDVEGSSMATAGQRVWAVGRAPASVGNRGFELLRAPAVDGPWASVLQVNFFGGFAIEPTGAIWFGDEGGGVYRSLDGAETFTNVSPATAVACLTAANGGVWGCTPGTPEQRALARWNDVKGTFDDVVALGDVTRMVECDPPTDVATTCALAWLEWRRDVIMVPPVRAGSADAGVDPPRGSTVSTSCSLVIRSGRGRSMNDVPCLALATLLLRRKRAFPRAR